MFNSLKTCLTLASLTALGLAAAAPTQAQSVFAVSDYTTGNVYQDNASTGASVGTYISGTNAALLGNATGIAFDAAGNLYATGHTGAILVRNAVTGTVTTLVAATGNGNNQLLLSGGNIYVSGNGNVLRYSLTGAAAPSAGNTGAVFTATAGGAGIVFDGSGNLYVLGNTNTGPLYKVNSSGVATQATFTNGGLTNNNLDSPTGLAFSGSNFSSLYIANYYGEDNGNNNVLQYNTTTGAASEFVVTSPVVAGQPLQHNVGITFGSDGDLYVAHEATGQILRYTASGAAAPSAGNTGAIFTSSIGANGNAQYIAFAPAPEPSQFAAFGLGILGVGSLLLKARKRSPSLAA